MMKLTRRTFMLSTVALAACKIGKNVLNFTGLTMGTTYTVVAIDHSNTLDQQTVKSATETALAQVNRSMSNWDASSEISLINAADAGAPVNLSQDLNTVMTAAAEVNAASQGRFDTTLGPVIELWGFGAPGATQMPTDDAIAGALAKSGHDNTLSLGGGAVEKKLSDTQIYLAGIGKGYGADHVGRALESLGVTDYLIEIGGDLYASGRNADGQPWQIGIETPSVADRGVFDVVGLSNHGLASSGDYRNYFEQDGVRYSHLIDPATGRPVEHKTASATVLADNAMLADAWSTAMLILGRERGLEIAQQYNIAVKFIERDDSVTTLKFKTHSSEAFDAITA